MNQRPLFTDAQAGFEMSTLYRKYIRGEMWKAKRTIVRLRSRDRCERTWGTRRCQNKATEVHHLTYDHLGDEQIAELQHLCRSCHEAVEHNKREARREKAVVTFATKTYGVHWLDSYTYEEMEDEFDSWLEGRQAA